MGGGEMGGSLAHNLNETETGPYTVLTQLAVMAVMVVLGSKSHSARVPSARVVVYVCCRSG